MMNPINCSIIIPCYNEEKNLPVLLKRCEEVFFETENLEIVLVDNGSTDNSSAVLDDLASKFSFITIVHVKANKGYGFGILAGLKVAKGEVLGWTHADMQTDLGDVLTGLNFFHETSEVERLFVKGKRYGRPWPDVFFTFCMSIFETFLLKRLMWDINAQPTLFHRSFYLNWEDPPSDFSLDLYAYYKAKKEKLKIKRFSVLFDERLHGVSSWNIGLASKYKFIKRTLLYSFSLNKKAS